MKKLIIISMSIIFFAAAVDARTIGTTTAPTPSPTATPVNTGNVNLQNPGLYSELEKTSKQGKSGLQNILVGAVVAGGIAAAVCASSMGSNPDCIKWGLTAALLGGAVAAVVGRSNNDADKALADVSVDHAPTTPVLATPDNGGGSNTNDGYITRYNEAVQTLRSRGIIVDPKKGTLTLANGKTYSQANLTTPSGMQSAGITPSDMAKLNKDLKEKVDKELKKGSDSTEGDGTVVSSGGHGHPMSSIEEGMPAQASLGIDRNPAQVQGLSVNYNGEPIGVSRSDLFQSITNRVRAVDNRDGFLTSP